jgi:hypothetical protein
LVLWLEPTSVQTDETGVVAWHDRSPYAHSAVQELERKRPTFSPTALQGLPGVTFDGIDDVLAVADHAALRFGTNDLLVIEVVFLHTTIASASQDRGCLLLGKTNPGYPYAGPALVANCLVEGSTTPRLCAQLDALNVAPSPTGGYDDGRPRFAGIYRWPSGEVDLRINGVVVRRVAPSSEIDVTAEGFPLLIGGDLNDGTQALNGVISEVVAAIATQSDDVRALETYLLRKYSQALLGTLEGNGGE